MNFIDRVLPQLPVDKANHVLYGFFVWGVAGLWLAQRFGYSPIVGSLALASIAGLVKEIYDHYTGGDVDPYDVAATAFGGAGVSLVLWIHSFA